MATLTETPEALALPARQPWGRFGAAFVFGLLAILAVATGAMTAFERSYEGRILPGIHVGSVDLTGLSTAQAATRLNAAYGSLTDGELAVVGGDASTSINYSDVERRLDVDAVIAEAMAVGRAGSLAERIAVDLRTMVGGHDIELRATLDEAKLRTAIEGVARGLAISPVDAVVATTETGFSVTRGIEGRAAEVDAALAAALTALRDPAAPSQISVPIAVHSVTPRITTDEAEAAVAEAARIAQDIRLTNGKVSSTIAAATIRSWLSYTTTADGTLRPFVNRAGPEASLNAFAPQIAAKPVEPQFVVDGKAVVGIIPGKDGAALDTSQSSTRVLQLLAARSNGSEVGTSWVVVNAVKPKLSDQEAASAAPRMTLISSWTTWFPYGINNNYGANIWIPARDIDGTVLAPGETFDFWKRIGPITIERGYGLGGAIINGHSEPQGALAGGICSNSTTLFNTALRAGLEMGARKNHYYYIDRYPIGLDATVFKSGSGSTQTMSFTNDTEYPILIRGYGWKSGSKGYVKYEMYSVPTGRKISFSTPIIKNLKVASDTVEYTTALKPGVRLRVEFPHDGQDVWVTRTVRDSAGNVIHTETYYSHYARITGLTQIGVAPSPPPPSPSPSP
ncbi:MAG TPA: VanW family protein [Candidatus Polarisedimenticolia bacterium]|nr:VanW family protein [Candidatus Polarisedimenticolia bacterium]